MKAQLYLKFNVRKLVFICVIIVLSVNNIIAQQPTIVWLGTLGGSSSHVYDISSDGSVVVGVSSDLTYNEKAFRWTLADGLQNLGALGGTQSKALGTSYDGSTVVGSYFNSDGIMRAFKWTPSSGMQDLEVGNYTEAVAVSDDGSYIVVNNGENGLAYRWNSGSLENLGTMAGGNYTYATGISSDGAVIVGYYRDSLNNPYAFRWTSSTGMEKIGTYYSFARAVSGDGNTVTGSETGSAGLHRAFKWTSSDGITLNIAGNFTYGLAVSYDGSIIVGDGEGAIRITGSGSEILNQTYSSLLTGNSNLNSATGISSDGAFIVGDGTNSATGRDEGFLLAINGITAVDEIENIPADFALSQNYPNPFNPSTKISWYSPISVRQTLKVYDIIGNEVETLVDEFKEAGSHVINFDANKLSSGIYIYKLQAGDYVSSKKMILLK